LRSRLRDQVVESASRIQRRRDHRALERRAVDRRGLLQQRLGSKDALRGNGDGGVLLDRPPHGGVEGKALRREPFLRAG
jgi:hypothetical protein